MGAGIADVLTTRERSGQRRRRPWKIVALVLGVPLILALLWKLLPMQQYLRESVDWIASTGPLGIAAYWLVYVLAAVIGIPRTLLNLAAGVLFSFPVALAAVLAGAATAHVLTFTIARTVARDWVRRRLARMPEVARVLEFVDSEAFKIVLLVRMNPFIPGVLKGYGFGTTNIPVGTYLLASVLGFLPLAVAHVYLGWAGGYAVLNDGAGSSPVHGWLLAGGIVASIVLAAGICFYGKRALDRRYIKVAVA